MTTVAPDVLRRLLTAADYAALPEDRDFRGELVEGHLVMSPRATFSHNRAGLRLAGSLDAAAPQRFAVAPDVDVDLQLVRAAEPATVRAPDVVVVTRGGYARVRRERGMLRASETILAVEIISPGSRRTDRLVKLREYEDAGIPNYWIVDLDSGPSLTAYRLVDGHYEGGDPITGSFITEVPFPVTIDLAALI